MLALFVTSNSFGSKLIRKFDGATASHVGISFDGQTVLDSTFRHRGVREWPIEVFETQHGRRVVDAIRIALPYPQRAEEWARSQIGKPYDVFALAGMALWGDWQEDDRWYCSEYMAGAIQEGGIDVGGGLSRISMRLAREIALLAAARGAA